MSPLPSEYSAGTTFTTTDRDGKQRTWEVREDGQVKQVNPGKGTPGAEEEAPPEEAPPEATQLPS
jgi:hypothetical protein